MPFVNLEVSEGIATLTFDRPEALNALNVELLGEFSKAVDGLGEREDVAVVILTGSGEKAFVAGADIKEMQEMAPLDAARFGELGQGILFRLGELPQVTIAAVNGFALGGGCEIAIACDLIYASEKAKIGQPEVNLGVIPGFGGTQRLLRLVGPMKAREMVFTGEMIDAKEAERIGLVAHVFPADNFVGRVREIAKRIIAKGPQAIRHAKAALRCGMDVDLRKGCEIEKDLFALCFAHPDQKEGMAAFVEKRKPNWGAKG